MNKYLKILLVVSVLAGISLLLGFVGNIRNNMLCTDLVIDISAKNKMYFVTIDDVNNKIGTLYNSLIGETLNTIDTRSIEEAIEDLPAVKNAQVYKTIDGKVKVEVVQRTPFLRIINKDGTGFYLDEKGLPMPLSNKYSARVLVATGEIQEPLSLLSLETDNRDSIQSQLLTDLYKLAGFINKDEFWRAQVQQININKQKDIEIVPRVGNHLIILGNCQNLEEKFAKLALFYKQGAKSYNWNAYSRINLKYKDQIVCTKK